MSGHMVYTARESHHCNPSRFAEGPVGSVWQCGDCGTYWRLEPISLLPAGWYVLGGLRLWWWQRRQRKETGR